MFALILGVCVSLGGALFDVAEFKVAEMKPHWQCTDTEGQENVRTFFNTLLQNEFAIIVGLEMHFPVYTVKPYQWMSAACIRQFVDGAVIIFDSDRFEVLHLFGETTSPSNVSEVQYDFQDSKGNNCVAANISAAGTRAFVGARMREKFTNIDFCLFGADFPHPETKPKWTREFSQIVEDCYQRFVFLGDTNLGIPSPSDKLEALELFPEHEHLHCSDPGTGYKTCCLDKDSHAPRYRSDRIITCSNTTNYGMVSHFKVEPQYICDSLEEHRFITAHVTLYSSPTLLL